MFSGPKKEHKKRAETYYDYALDEYENIVEALDKKECKKAINFLRRSSFYLGAAADNKRMFQDEKLGVKLVKLSEDLKKAEKQISKKCI